MKGIFTTSFDFVLIRLKAELRKGVFDNLLPVKDTTGEVGWKEIEEKDTKQGHLATSYEWEQHQDPVWSFPQATSDSSLAICCKPVNFVSNKVCPTSEISTPNTDQ